MRGRRVKRQLAVAPLVLATVLYSSPRSFADSCDRTAKTVARKATDFMMNTVSNRGGFLWTYAEDLSEQWGEVPARTSMIWVQDPGTVGVGNVLLRAHEVTGDAVYLEYAGKVADALISGQHPSGGWHYFIDFDRPGVIKWYRETASRCWGWMEYYHYDGNCTFDDGVTAGATRFLLDLYSVDRNPQYRAPLLAAMDFVLESQYAIGAWPQRYPLDDAYPDDSQAEYTSYYTFNDNVIQDNINLLLEAHRKLGSDEYKQAALRGMDFVAVSQLPAPQAGWGQQYDADLNLVPARPFEPAALMPSQTVTNIASLETYYGITGNREYLQGIPDALDWLDNSHLPPGHSDSGHTHATFYELGTNKPLYAHREGTGLDDSRYWVDYEPSNILPGYGYLITLNIDALRHEFERVRAMTLEEAMAAHKAREGNPPRAPRVSSDRVEELNQLLDERGAWVETVTLPNYEDYINGPKRTLSGIVTATYIRNMHTLLDHMESLKP